MSLDTQHAENEARKQCLELERQAKSLLSIGYKLNELEIVSFASDGRKEVWPKSLINYLPPSPIVFKDFKVPGTTAGDNNATKWQDENQRVAAEMGQRIEDKIMAQGGTFDAFIQPLKWYTQVPWVSGFWWVRAKGKTNSAIVLNVKVSAQGDDDPSIEYEECNGKFYPIGVSCEYAGPIPEPIN